MAGKKYHHGDLKNALIRAGLEILARDGIDGLSLRKAAQEAGVSHAAPYAHFTDKQALVAAISAEGYRLLFNQLKAVREAFQDEPQRQLVEAAWAYVQFAQSDPAHFRVTFSSTVKQEKDYPALVEITAKCFEQVVSIIASCQAAGVLRPAPPEAMAVSIWSAVHGFASLLIEGQISHQLLDQMTIRQALVFTLDQLTLVALAQGDFSGDQPAALRRLA